MGKVKTGMDGNTDSALAHQKSFLCCVQNSVMRGKIITLSTANQNKNFFFSFFFFTLERKRKKGIITGHVGNQEDSVTCRNTVTSFDLSFFFFF